MGTKPQDEKPPLEEAVPEPEELASEETPIGKIKLKKKPSKPPWAIEPAREASGPLTPAGGTKKPQAE